MSTVATIERPVRRAMRSPKMPSTAWIWMGGLIGVLGLAGAIVWGAIGVTGYLQRVEDLTRMSVPGHLSVQSEGAGEQFVYYEGGGVVPLEQLRLQVTDPRGETVALEPYDLDLRYDAPGNTGVGQALATFRTAGAGEYAVTSAGAAPPGSTVAVGESVAKNVIPTLFGVFALLLVTVGGGLALIIVTVARRSRVRSDSGQPA